MSKKRPGVAAAVRLSQCTNVSTWQAVSTQWSHVVDHATDLDEQITQLGQALRAGTKKSITKTELLEIIIPWKFAVGKPRHALRKHLESNTAAAVVQCTQRGIDLARAIDADKDDDDDDDDDLESNIKAALLAVTQLAGVGPATASLVLSLVRPDVFCYLFDEVIDCFCPQRTYTMPVYLKCNAACRHICAALEAANEWTPARVARTLWTAARVCATNSFEDYTLSSSLPTKTTTSSSSSRKRKATSAASKGQSKKHSTARNATEAATEQRTAIRTAVPKNQGDASLPTATKTRTASKDQSMNHPSAC